MFATLASSYPVEPGLEGEEAVGSVVALQVELGLEPISDGGQRWPDPFAVAASGRPGFAVAAWQATRAHAGDRSVRQVLPGPYSLGWRSHDRRRSARERATLAAAERLHHEIVGLADAGCPLVWIDEPDAIRIGASEAERILFADAHCRLLGDLPNLHATLAISGGTADVSGPAMFLAAPYRSFFFDLIEGPDNWRLIARLPGECGVICGAMDARTPGPADRELLVWAAHYAASTGGRGLARVGLAPSGGLGHLAPDVARRKIEGLVRAADVALASPDELSRVLDPRAVQGPSARLARRSRGSAAGKTP
jgi:methionine synthase II (cobalamin-independent)